MDAVDPCHILAIETSCDETSAAIIRDGRHVVANVVSSQIALHQPYGGVVPEIASRQHMRAMLPVVEQALDEAALGWNRLDAVAVTRGPGLAGALLVGVNTAKAIAFARGLPLLGIDHMEAHLYGNWLIPTPDEVAALRATVAGAAAELLDPAEEPRFPLLSLVVSGGHTELVLAHDHGQYALIGQTRDDAAGEAFDKVARLLGLPYPGGPSIQAAARDGRTDSVTLPRGMVKGGYEFSFSGMKTAVARLVERTPGLPVADVAAGFQEAVVDVLVRKTVDAAIEFGVVQIGLAGGVAANLLLRRTLSLAAPVPVRIPPIRFCTDNAAIVGSAAYYRLRAGDVSDLAFDVEPSLRLAGASPPTPRSGLVRSGR